MRQVRVRDWDGCLPRLRSRELDFFVAEISTLKHESDLEAEALSEHPLYFVGRHAHPLAGRDNVDAADTFAYPFIAPARIPPRMLGPMLQARRKFAGRKAVPQAFPSLEFNVLAEVKRIVESSDAVTALTLSGCATELQQQWLELLGTKPWLSSRYGIVSLKGHPMSSAALRVREFVAEAEAEVAPFRGEGACKLEIATRQDHPGAPRSGPGRESAALRPANAGQSDKSPRIRAARADATSPRPKAPNRRLTDSVQAARRSPTALAQARPWATSMRPLFAAFTSSSKSRPVWSA
jgi:hypothetical protein